MSAKTEQVYTSAIYLGYGPKDDAAIVNMYWAGDVTTVKCTLSKEERESRIKMLIEALVAIHIASASESIMMADECGIPLKQFFELVQMSAGASKVFGMYAEAMSNDEGAEPQTGRTMKDCEQNLVNLIDMAMAVNCACPVTNGALNMFSLFGRRLGDDIEASNLLRIWE